jgi:hypothetical protein
MLVEQRRVVRVTTAGEVDVDLVDVKHRAQRFAVAHVAKHVNGSAAGPGREISIG